MERTVYFRSEIRRVNVKVGVGVEVREQGEEVIFKSRIIIKVREGRGDWHGNNRQH